MSPQVHLGLVKARNNWCDLKLQCITVAIFYSLIYFYYNAIIIL